MEMVWCALVQIPHSRIQSAETLLVGKRMDIYAHQHSEVANTAQRLIACC